MRGLWSEWTEWTGARGWDAGELWQLAASVLLVTFLAATALLLATRWRNLLDR